MTIETPNDVVEIVFTHLRTCYPESALVEHLDGVKLIGYQDGVFTFSVPQTALRCFLQDAGRLVNEFRLWIPGIDVSLVFEAR